jgi:hypothetical protein
MTALENYHGVPANTFPRPLFGTGGAADSLVSNIYDTWSTHYETNGIDDDRDGVIDEGANGVDDWGDNKGFDNIDASRLEMESPPPYPHRLRGLQIKIRAIEKYSKQVREVTLYQEFPGE